MDERVECFFMEPATQVRRWLRRFTSSERDMCRLPKDYCNAMTHLDDIPYPLGVVDHSESPLVLDDVVPKTDSLWPKKCEKCGRWFNEDDAYQVFAQRLYRDPRSGLLTPWEAAEAGAMIDAWWHSRKGPDGLVLMVKLPNRRDWIIDRPAADSATPWTRIGVPPKISAHPSVHADDWHGHLIDGVLVPA